MKRISVEIRDPAHLAIICEAKRRILELGERMEAMRLEAVKLCDDSVRDMARLYGQNPDHASSLDTNYLGEHHVAYLIVMEPDADDGQPTQPGVEGSRVGGGAGERIKH